MWVPRPGTLKNKMSEKVAVFDTTLRDGEQAAGTRLGRREKLVIARQLAELRVDVIEAGYPNSSPEDFEAVQTIGREIAGPTICALSRAVPADIEACARALAGCARPRIHTGIGASDIHILGKFRDEKYGRDLAEKRATILQMAVDAVRLAREAAADVEFYAEDAGRAQRDFLLEMIGAVVDAGATVINIPDTTGYAMPEPYGELIGAVCGVVGGRAVVSVHCHDDLGLAVANTLAGIRHGARQVEGTINGVGERAGNAALEEVIMALRTRADYFGVDTGIETRELYKTSRLVAELLGIAAPPNKAVVGCKRVLAQFRHSRGWGFETAGHVRDHAARGRGHGGEPGGVDGPHRTARAARPAGQVGLRAFGGGAGSGIPAIPDRGGQEARGLRRGLTRHRA